MNWLDKTIGYLNPEAGLRRVRARAAADAVRLSYEGARTGRRTAGWLTSSTSANAEVGADLVRLRQRSRSLVRDNYYAKKAKTQYRTRVVGTGITCQWKDKRAATLWAKWVKSCSADGLPNLAAVEQLVSGAEFESGEVIIRLRVRRKTDRMSVPLQVQVLESDFLDHEKTQDLGDGGYIIHGVEFDKIGRRIAYWLYDQHPGEVIARTKGTESKRVPRYDPNTGIEQVIHLFEAASERPGQVRGVPHLHAVLLKMRDVDDWETAEIVRKKTEACLVGTVTSIDTTGDAASVAPILTDASGNKVEQMAPGMFLYGTPGSDVKFNQPGHAGGYEEYKRCSARDLAAGLFMPYELLTGDFSQTNYSNYRGGLLSYRDRIESVQENLYIPALCEPIAEAFLRLAFISGALPEGEYERVWSPPAFDLLDREAEARADEIEGRVGTKTWPQLIARQGYDPEEQIAVITEYKSRLEKAGIVFSEKQLQQQGAEDAAQRSAAAK